ncbi:hypothetical protein CUJ83_00945 [Methanocella sp. CWC-04]|uniref:Uncharacterized protein n=1 Tax=Methanooceanicella nereidis TaxID=2052831 RepID=A0AAP2W4P5_9EURY|nr:hypothetical protein [Methanocella sp. CWC-04]MCD1293563.1 hypothetical protein [Methanocella sp. CWC-04]
MQQKDRAIKYIIIVCLVLVFIFTSMCLNDKTDHDNFTDHDKFIFIDHHVHINGSMVQGEYMGPMIDFPTYSYDEETKTLSGLFYFEVNDTLKMIYGDGRSLSGAAGGGAGTVLQGVYGLPYEKDAMKIVSMDSSGTVTMEYNNETIILRSGEKWENITSGVRKFDLADNYAIVNLTRTDTIVNHGILEKTKIINHRK